jgi:transcriptional regulator with XRE-family HTH domain
MIIDEKWRFIVSRVTIREKNGKADVRVDLTPADRVRIACELMEEPLKDIAGRAGMSPTLFSDIIHGRKGIGLDLAVRLAKTLHLPLHRLLGVDDAAAVKEKAADDLVRRMKRHIRASKSMGEDTERILLKDIEKYERSTKQSA